MAQKNSLQGTKFLITAGALAGTVGGWIVLSAGAATTPNGAVLDPALENLLNQPLPTLVQPGGQISVGGNQVAITGLQPSAQQPLRSVSRPPVVQNAPRSSAPRPVVTTRSSKK